MAKSLAFCLEDDADLDWIQDLGYTVGSIAAQVACRVFGRDEGGGDFAFTQKCVDSLIRKWSTIVRPDGASQNSKPTADTVQALELTISDTNKLLLLANSEFLPYLVDALLLVRMPECVACRSAYPRLRACFRLWLALT